MMTAATKSPHAPAPRRGPWQELAMRVVRYLGLLKPALASAPLTHRQVLLVAQDKRKA